MSVSGRKKSGSRNCYYGSVSGPRNWQKTSVSGSRNWRFLSVSFLDPETDIMDQFLGPETDIMGEGNFMIKWIKELINETMIELLDEQDKNRQNVDHLILLKLHTNPIFQSDHIPNLWIGNDRLIELCHTLYFCWYPGVYLCRDVSHICWM